MKATVYNNVRCSKCRDAISILEEHGTDINIVNYLVDRLTTEELTELFEILDIRPRDAVRRREKVFKELDLASKIDDDQLMIEAIAENPILLERPIVVIGDRGIIGRPPENVYQLIS